MGKRIMIEAFCRTPNGFEFCPVSGYSVEIPGQSALRFGVHKSGGGVDEWWTVTELSSGLQMCRKRTRRDAEDKIRAMMGTEEGRWAVEEMVRRWPARARAEMGVDVEALKNGIRN